LASFWRTSFRDCSVFWRLVRTPLINREAYLRTRPARRRAGSDGRGAFHLDCAPGGLAARARVAQRSGEIGPPLSRRARYRFDDLSVRTSDRDFDFICRVQREAGIAAAMDHPAAV
jgi:hypothetical protein